MKPGQLTWRERGWLWIRLGIRLVIVVAVVALLAVFGGTLLSLFAPFLVALVTAALLNPLVKWFQRRLGLSRPILAGLLMILVFGALGGAIVFLGYAVVSELVSLAQN